MPRLGVDGGDDPVRSHAPCDAKRARLGLLKVLAHDSGEQLRRRLHLVGQLAAIEGQEDRLGIACERVDEGLARNLVVPVALRLPGGRVVAFAAKTLPQVPSE